MDIVKIYESFPTENDCIDHLESIRWNKRPQCPYCKSVNATPLAKEKRHHCNNCNTSFSVTVGTVFHQTHLPLQKWFLATTLILNAKKGISARQLSRDLHVNKDTAWRISMKIREAMCEREQLDLLTGIVEADETYIGGKPRKGTGPHKPGPGTKKIPVVGMIERKGKIKAEVVKNKNLNNRKLKSLIRRNVDITSTTLITDEYKAYIGIRKIMPHKIIDHTIWYVDGDIHTNTIDSFWALLKRGIVGQFHKVSLLYLPRYIDEFCYRYNHRFNDDLFNLTIRKALEV